MCSVQCAVCSVQCEVCSVENNRVHLHLYSTISNLLEVPLMMASGSSPASNMVRRKASFIRLDSFIFSMNLWALVGWQSTFWRMSSEAIWVVWSTQLAEMNKTV